MQHEVARNQDACLQPPRLHFQMDAFYIYVLYISIYIYTSFFILCHSNGLRTCQAWTDFLLQNQSRVIKSIGNLGKSIDHHQSRRRRRRVKTRQQDFRSLLRTVFGFGINLGSQKLPKVVRFGPSRGPSKKWLKGFRTGTEFLSQGPLLLLRRPGQLVLPTTQRISYPACWCIQHFLLISMCCFTQTFPFLTLISPLSAMGAVCRFRFQQL